MWLELMCTGARDRQRVLSIAMAPSWQLLTNNGGQNGTGMQLQCAAEPIKVVEDVVANCLISLVWAVPCVGALDVVWDCGAAGIPAE